MLFVQVTALKKMHRHGWINKKADHHGGATSLPVPTGGPVDVIRTGDRAKDALAPFQFLRVDRKNLPQVKCGEDDGAIQPRGNPSSIN